MADKSINELPAVSEITPTDAFVTEQAGAAKKVLGQILLNWLTKAADGHGGIQSIVNHSTSGLVDTYRITLADTTTFDFTVTNGKSITGVSKVSTVGLVDTYQITYNSGVPSTFTVTNGAKGDKGGTPKVWVRYASQEPTDASHNFGMLPDDWMGFCSNYESSAPTDWKAYTWFQVKGDKGNPGDPATMQSFAVDYMGSDSGTITPSGSWLPTVPAIAQGKYLWTRTTIQFNTGSPVVAYSVSRYGIDGSGAVSTVNQVAPDPNGNVSLTAENVGARPNTWTPSAEDVGALPTSGGTMTGPLSMGGNKITGLGSPTANTDAVSKEYVNSLTVRSSITLSASDWVDNAQTVNISDVTATAGVIVSQAPGDSNNYVAYLESGVYCTAQGDGVLTFRCESVPSIDLIVNVEIHKWEG